MRHRETTNRETVDSITLKLFRNTYLENENSAIPTKEKQCLAIAQKSQIFRLK